MPRFWCRWPFKPALTDFDAKCAAWASKMARIAGDEPPVLRALDAKAYNDEFDALEFSDPGERLYIPWWHRVLGSLQSFEGHTYKKRSKFPGYKTALEPPVA